MVIVKLPRKIKEPRGTYFNMIHDTLGKSLTLVRGGGYVLYRYIGEGIWVTERKKERKYILGVRVRVFEKVHQSLTRRKHHHG
jgi:hypothetical protein